MYAITHEKAMQFDPAALLGLKLAAFYWMVLDHMDWLLFDGQGAHASVGRLVFPIFGIVLAYNMARSDAKALGRTALRLACIGVITTPVYAYLTGQWLPLNIMLTLSASVVVYVLLVDRAFMAALLVGGIVGWSVDYAWFGVFGVAVTAYAMRFGGYSLTLAAIFGFAGMLTAINGNLWAFAAIPLVLLAAHVRPGTAPRMKWLFWVGYPAHLGILALAKLAM